MAYNHFKYLKADGSQGTPEDYVSKEDLTGEYLFNRKINGVSTQYILKQPDKNGESFNYYIIKSPLLINYYKYAFKTYINGVWGEEVYYATNDIPVLGESIYNRVNELVGKVIEIGHQKITLNTDLVLYRYFDKDIKSKDSNVNATINITPISDTTMTINSYNDDELVETETVEMLANVPSSVSTLVKQSKMYIANVVEKDENEVETSDGEINEPAE